MDVSKQVAELIGRWDTGEGKPYKGRLFDFGSYDGDGEPPLSCMCAQGQVLHVAAGHEPEWFRDRDQAAADLEVANLLNISRAHSILLRNINDRQDGAPSITLTDPEKVLGSQWSKLLDFWWMFHCFDGKAWKGVIAAWVAAWVAAGDAAGVAAGDAAWVAAGAAAWDAAGAAAGDAAGAAAGDDAWDAARAAAREIQGFELLGERGHDVFFLPMFGIKTLDDIPARPADYGLGLVPKGAA